MGLVLGWVVNLGQTRRLVARSLRNTDALPLHTPWRMAAPPVEPADAPVLPLEHPACLRLGCPQSEARARPSFALGHLEVLPTKPPKYKSFSYADALEQFTSTSSTPVARAFRASAVSLEPGRRRDLFPLPDLPPGEATDQHPCLRTQTRLLISALNVLWGGGSVVPYSQGPPTAAQRRVITRLLTAAAEWLLRMADCDDTPSATAAWQSFEDAVTAEPLRLQADLVDLPSTAATCDPYHLLGPELRTAWDNPDCIVPRERTGHDAHRVHPRDRQEYLRLTVRELNLGKLVLLKDAKGLGSIFPVKKTGNRQRAVWHGTLVSEGSSRPLKPRRLADPSAFQGLDWDAGTRVLWSKRDAASFFDTLRCPEALRPWFGRPPVTLAELRAAGANDADALERWAVEGGVSVSSDTPLFPCSQVWPMGYSWSSAIAQDVTLGLLRHGGFAEEQVLCATEAPPLDQRECLFVLTDDCLMAHVVHAPGNSDEGFHERDVPNRVGKLDQAMSDNGVQQKPEKDVTAAEELTGMGCHLTGNPPRAEPDACSIRRAVLAIWGLQSRASATPGAVSSLLGVCQWFALLARPAFAVFRDVYAFTARRPLDVALPVPRRTKEELALFSALAPLVRTTLARNYAPVIIASDAAPEFGFGVSIASADPGTLKELGRLAERRGDYVRLNREQDPDAEPERERLGQAHRIALRRCDFRHVLSVRAKRIEHSGVLELNGALLLLRWLSRVPRHHGKRLFILLDAKAVLGALQKGRSSSRSLGRLLQRVSAYVLACDFAPRYLYVPTEDMPADAPSRGVRARPTRRRVLKPMGFSKLDRKHHRMIAKWDRANALMEEFDRSSSGSSSYGSSASSGSSGSWSSDSCSPDWGHR